MTTRPLETSGKAPRYQDGDEEVIDSRSRGFQERAAAKFQADIATTVAMIKASRGGPGDMAEMLGLVSE
jgi:hypothetical protein